MFHDILTAIESYDSIAIYRHANPDGDAFGAQFGMKQWILDHYPTKQVVAIGIDNDMHDYFPTCQAEVTLDWANTLALVLDCANVARLDNADHLFECGKIVKIDHHPNVESFGNPCYVDTTSAATCQILVELFASSGLGMSKQVATYLAFGIVTDSVNFAAAYTSTKTFNAFALCLQQGIDHVELFKVTSQLPFHQYQAITFMRNHICVENGVAYCILDYDHVKDAGFSMDEIKDHVNVMKGIRDVEAWAMFHQLETGTYRVSLRSYRANINQVAIKHNGGGHLQASGCNASDNDEIKCILDELMQVVKEYKNA